MPSENSEFHIHSDNISMFSTSYENTSPMSVRDSRSNRQLVHLDLHEQKHLLLRANFECELKLSKFQNSSSQDSTSGRGCEMVWDNILCWDQASPGSLQQQPCPNYIHGFDTNEFATKLCTPNGTWYRQSENSKHWTNYTACHTAYNIKVDEDHGERLKLIQTIGYGISLCSLVIAVSLMLCSRLKSKSNTLHLNLFLAFILRASFSFAHRILFVNGLGLKKDVEWKSDGTLAFIHYGLHWECRLLQTTFMYTICASQMWIFVEGLYLHMLIYRTLSTESNGVRPYIILGWVLPLAVVIPWIFVKALVDNTLCWNVSANHMYIWILQGPMLATVVLNFVFFLNISRVLCSRVRSSQRHMGRSKYRHLVKFILVLVPLFGVFYIILTVVFPLGYASRFDIRQMYAEQTYNAFQGLLLALLFCFLNKEVHSEIKRIWWRRRTRKRDSVTRSFVLSSFKRNTFSTQTSFSSSQPQRAAGRLPSTDSSDSVQLTWCGRAVVAFMRCLGREPGPSQYTNKINALTASENDSFYVASQNFNNIDVEIKMKIPP
ncbi:hypothetical protein BsWGS_04501 [Bradybaena similaris]